MLLNKQNSEGKKVILLVYMIFPVINLKRVGPVPINSEARDTFFMIPSTLNNDLRYL